VKHYVNKFLGPANFQAVNEYSILTRTDLLTQNGDPAIHGHSTFGNESIRMAPGTYAGARQKPGQTFFTGCVMPALPSFHSDPST
jgi:hypothetical protein